MSYSSFPLQDIATLIYTQVAKKTLQEGIQKLVRSRRRGNALLLHYYGDEADYCDEITCPTDLD